MSLLRIIAFLTLLAQGQSQSQVSQDEILDDILGEIGETNRWYVEIGFNEAHFEGGSGSNTFRLWEKGWVGLLLDGDFSNQTINLQKEFVTSRNIISLFQKYQVPLEPDYISIDIDSADIWVLRTMLTVYRPRVISVEYNTHYNREDSIAFPDPSWMPVLHDQSHFAGTCFYGSSARALIMVAREHGYKLAAVATPLDLFFVRGTLWKDYEDKDDSIIDRLMSASLFDDYPHFWHPMTMEQAANLVDYETFSQGGTVCEARAQAATVLRNRARQSGGEGCFSLLSEMPIPDCGYGNKDTKFRKLAIDYENENGLMVSAPFEFSPHELRAITVLRALSFVRLNNVTAAPGCAKHHLICIAELIADSTLTYPTPT